MGVEPVVAFPEARSCRCGPGRARHRPRCGERAWRRDGRLPAAVPQRHRARRRAWSDRRRLPTPFPPPPPSATMWTPTSLLGRRVHPSSHGKTRRTGTVGRRAKRRIHGRWSIRSCTPGEDAAHHTSGITQFHHLARRAGKSCCRQRRWLATAAVLHHHYEHVRTHAHTPFTVLRRIRMRDDIGQARKHGAVPLQLPRWVAGGGEGGGNGAFAMPVCYRPYVRLIKRR